MYFSWGHGCLPKYKSCWIKAFVEGRDVWLSTSEDTNTMIKYKYKYKYCRSKAWMCDQDGVLQGKPMHRDDCHYIITVSSQIQIRISAISFLSSQLLPISNDCQFCFRYDCHHHQRSVGLLMWRSSSAKISGPNVKVFCVAISKAICSRGRMRRTPMGISASAAFCLCWTWRSMCIQIHKYKCSNTNTYWWMTWMGICTFVELSWYWDAKQWPLKHNLGNKQKNIISLKLQSLSLAA